MMTPKTWLLVFLFTLTTAANACTVPVFRYALERWATEPFRTYVFHRGPLTAGDLATVNALKNAGETPGLSNVTVETVDLAGSPSKDLLEIWDANKSEHLPWTVVMFPESSDRLPPAWTGKLDTKNVEALLNSPVRQEIGQRLLNGQSVVWVLLESGSKDADTAAAELLNKEITELQKSIALPQQPNPEEADPASRLRSGLPLRITFSTMRLSRDDPKEQVFVKMLLQSQPATKEPVPMVFPIFGRGRLLAGLRGKEFSPVSLKAAAEFLMGACSCQVKELNPGVDLLMTVDWDKIFDEEHVLAVRAKTPELKDPGDTQKQKPVDEKKPVVAVPEEAAKLTQVVQQPTAPSNVAAEPQGQPALLWIAVAVAGLLVIVTGRAVLKQSR